MRLLWIDDQISPKSAEIVYLQREGYDLDCAVTGAAGLSMARAASHDGILLDLRLPDINGLTVLARLRTYSTTTPVLVVTGFGDFESARFAGRLGARGFLAKPVFIDELETAIQRLASGAATAEGGISDGGTVPRQESTAVASFGAFRGSAPGRFDGARWNLSLGSDAGRLSTAERHPGRIGL